MQAFLTLLKFDLGQLARSWLVRLWIVLLLAPAIFLVVVAASQQERASETLAAYIAAVLAPLSWLAISVIAAGSIAGETNMIADAILSKSVKRTEYMAAKIAARMGATLGIYFVVMIPFVYLVSRYGANDTSIVGTVVGLIVVGTLLAFLVAYGIAMSVLLRNMQLAAVIVLLTVLVSGFALQFLGLTWMSTTAVINALPRTFRGETPLWEQIRVFGVFSALAAGAVSGSMWLFREKDL